MQTENLETPSLLLNRDALDRNIARMNGRMKRLGVRFRPHLKTCKSIAAARLMMETPAGPATVSTLHEAEAFAEAGVTDMIYAVGIAPHRLDRVVALRRRGIDLAIVLDTEAQANAVAEKTRETGMALPALIEIDCDGHRGGLPADDARLIPIAAQLAACGALRGVLTHAGESYNCRDAEALAAAAEQERAATVSAAARIRAAGLACPIVSVGSTPTALSARALDGVSEVRAGVYAFFDLVMAGIGVCSICDIALSVLATVIGRQEERGTIFVDAGWMALSSDRGTASQPLDQGYGVVCDLAGKPFDDLIVIGANQEHGVIGLRPHSGAGVPALPVGTKVRILPNHACATAAQHERYHIVDEKNPALVTDIWDRLRGW